MGVVVVIQHLAIEALSQLTERWVTTRLWRQDRARDG
jgi:hypothetical protein